MHTSDVSLSHVYKSYLNALIKLMPNPDLIQALSEKPDLRVLKLIAYRLLVAFVVLDLGYSKITRNQKGLK